MRPLATCSAGSRLSLPRNEDRRVAVTGLGIVSPVGSELESFWQRVVRGETGIKPCSFDSSFDPLEILAAQVEDFDPDAHFPARLMTQLDRNTQFAIVAARSAVADAGLVLDDDERPHAAVIMGTGIGGIGTLEQGDILVTNSTDPGWTPVFSLIGGLVLETGGMLSHGACLSREYNLPAVTIADAAKRIRDGAWVTLDGDTGELQVLDEPVPGTTA